MSTKTPRERIYAVQDALDLFLTRYTLAQLLPDQDQRPAAKTADALLTTIEDAQRKLLDLLTAKAGAVRTDAERVTDLVAAVERVAFEVGARMFRLDALHSKIAQTVVPEAQAYWTGKLPATVHGMLLNESTIAAELAKRGILIWYHDPDKRWRIVNPNWLTAHADIRTFVAGERIPGHVCRFCRIVELPTSQQFIAVDAERPGPLATVNGITQLQPGRIYAHEQCVPHWNRWVEIANRYPTQEAAEAADRDAGRQSGVVPQAPEPEFPDATAPAGFFHVQVERAAS